MMVESMDNSSENFKEIKILENKKNMNELDTDWLYLIFTAKSIGIEKSEVREFLEKNTYAR
jgi:hypothetical protein